MSSFQPQPDWELISQGAEARLWKIPNYLPQNQTCIAKERFSKSYRHPLLDSKLTKSRVKAEAKCLVKCRRGGVPTPAVWGVDPPVLYLQFVDGVTVRQYLSENSSKSTKRSIDYPSLATQMGELIAKTHNVGVVHGDLTTSNMILQSNNNSIVLIDFGLARVSTDPEELAVDLYVLERALLSTHPELEDLKFLDQVLAAYKSVGNKSDAVLQRLAQVRLRGRKRECFG